jgi:hypothetical protein
MIGFDPGVCPEAGNNAPTAVVTATAITLRVFDIGTSLELVSAVQEELSKHHFIKR